MEQPKKPSKFPLTNAMREFKNYQLKFYCLA